MRPIRRSRRPLRRAALLAASPALVLGAACGDDGGDDAFCSQVQDQLGAVQAPTTGAGLAEGIAALSAIDPPAEIAADWTAMLEMLRALDAVEIEDPDPAQMAVLDDPAHLEAAENVRACITDTCGVTPPG
jgi:hypothetical protein